MGSTDNHNCGDINNLCGLVANYPTAASCYDMYMVRFNGTTEAWATKLTDTSATLPAYGTSATGGGNVIFIWSEYAHNGRIASDGTNYAGYFGAAITVPGQACVGSSTLATGVNIHQGDRMKVVNGSGALQSERLRLGLQPQRLRARRLGRRREEIRRRVQERRADGRQVGPARVRARHDTIYPVDLNYSNLGNVMTAGGGGYWIVRQRHPRRPAGERERARRHPPAARREHQPAPTPNEDITLVSDGLNDRAPHLAAYGAGKLVAAWETSTATGDFSQNAAGRQMWLQVLDATTGMPPAGRRRRRPGR